MGHDTSLVVVAQLELNRQKVELEITNQREEKVEAYEVEGNI
jgi:hypothetical protein